MLGSLVLLCAVSIWGSAGIPTALTTYSQVDFCGLIRLASCRWAIRCQLMSKYGECTLCLAACSSLKQTSHTTGICFWLAAG